MVDKVTAREKTTDAIRRGRLKRQPCEVCGKKAEAHHPDYRSPYKVRWLCRKHHRALHRKTRVVKGRCPTKGEMSRRQRQVYALLKKSGGDITYKEMRQSLGCANNGPIQ